MTRCPGCQSLIAEDDTLCRVCGVPQVQPVRAAANGGQASGLQDDAGATVLRDSLRARTHSGEVIVVRTPAAQRAGGRNLWLVALGVVGAATIVTLALLVTLWLRPRPKPEPAKPGSTTTVVSDVRITAPANGTAIDMKYPVVARLAVDGDRSTAKIEWLVDGKVTTAVYDQANQDYVIAVPNLGRHSVVARTTWDGGERSSKPIEIVRTSQGR